ncbi:hypothetical protein EON79_04805 [bacterium]|nr:MAG: hypothetical protein EON79_04805 [bacterium]
MLNRLPELVPLMIPILALMIPIVAIMTTHQRKMAEIMRDRNPIVDGQVDALRREVAELKQLVHQQSISIDNLVSVQTRSIPDLRDRVSH